MILSIPKIFLFFFILARIIGMFSVTPILSDRAIPQMVKLVLAVWISMIMWYILPIPKYVFTNNLEIILAFIGEFFVGFVIGFISRIIFVGIQLAGSLMDMQMGLSVAAFFDPSTGGQTTIMERLMFYMSILVIFLTNSHHLFFVNIYESFKVIPILKLAEFRGLQGQLGYLASNIFLTAMDLSITVLVIIFLLDFSLGLLARLAPQVNVFSLGFQIKPVLGLWIFVLVMPILVQEFDSIVQKMTIETYKLFEGVKVR